VYYPPEDDHANADRDDADNIELPRPRHRAKWDQDAGILDRGFSPLSPLTRGPALIADPGQISLDNPQTDDALPATATNQSPEHTHHVDFPPNPLDFHRCCCAFPSHCCCHSVRVGMTGGNRQFPCHDHGNPWFG
jgi:hypothetical protein